MLENWPNGNLVARALGIRFWNEINPGFVSAAQIRLSVSRQTDRNVSLVLALGRRREKGKGFWGEIFGSYNFSSDLSISNIH